MNSTYSTGAILLAFAGGCAFGGVIFSAAAPPRPAPMTDPASLAPAPPLVYGPGDTVRVSAPGTDYDGASGTVVAGHVPNGCYLVTVGNAGRVFPYQSLSLAPVGPPR